MFAKGTGVWHSRLPPSMDAERSCSSAAFEAALCDAGTLVSAALTCMFCLCLNAALQRAACCCKSAGLPNWCRMPLQDWPCRPATPPILTADPLKVLCLRCKTP
jgi:hypothetical protein